MVDISSQLTCLINQDVPSFLAFLILKGENNEPIRESDNATAKSLYVTKKSLFSTATK